MNVFELGFVGRARPARQRAVFAVLFPLRRRGGRDTTAEAGYTLDLGRDRDDRAEQRQRP